MRYCGRDFSEEEIKQIQSLIAEDATRSRAELSRLTCQALAWYKPDGGLKEMSARVAMLRMQEDGHLLLPPPRNKRPDPSVRITPKTDQGEVIEMPVSQLSPLRLEQVKQKSQSRLWNEYIHRYHYLGHKLLPGAQLRYFVYTKAQPIALLGFGAAAWQTAPRDNYIGWNHEQRKRNLHLVVNNARFLILPWIKSHNLASKILSLVAKVLPDHWQAQYGYRPLLLETFVETPRFKGTCYKAANWVLLGQTKGRGKLGPSGIQSVPIKDLLVYPLDRNFQDLLRR
ncbi:MAG: DUF4338 domain-containing protein [Gammaproteobacteria bacterium]|nr:DUF4338 domain-containing protein [Gammaproteobacteria bacterium]